MRSEFIPKLKAEVIQQHVFMNILSVSFSYRNSCFVKQLSAVSKAASLLSSSVRLSSRFIDWLSAPPVQSRQLLSFTQSAHSGPAPGRAAETRLHQFQMKHQHFLPLHQSTAPARSPRSLTALLSVCVMRNGTVCECVCNKEWECVSPRWSQCELGRC